MQQGTAEWHAWRKQGIGASESAAIMGISPYSTPLMVFNDKTGRGELFEGNLATQRGQDLEGKARAMYELVAMEDMPPAVAAHPKWDFLRASLDGLRGDGKLILELKVPGSETHALAKAGKVPEHYYIQVQHQLLVTGADLCHFFSYSYKDETYALVEVRPDLELQGKIVSECMKFWDLVKAGTPPPLTDRDVKVINDNDKLKVLAINLRLHKDTLPKSEVDAIKARIVELGGHPKIRCGDVQVSVVNRNGKFSYHKLTISGGES